MRLVGHVSILPETRKGLVLYAKWWLLRASACVAFLAAWELSVRMGWADPVLVGEPGGTLRAFVKQFGSDVVSTDLGYTVFETFTGFAISVGAGGLVGVALSRSPGIFKLLAPLITAANSLPRVALAPLFILWFGLGALGKVALVVSFVFFVMLTTTVAAFTQPNNDFELLASSLGCKTWQEVTYFKFPAAVPTLVAGLELSLIYSFLAAVSGEIIGGYHGIGVQLTTFSNAFRIDEFLALLILLMIVSTLATGMLRLLTRPLVRWHEVESARGAS